jgi:FkbM family methyltransferase
MQILVDHDSGDESGTRLTLISTMYKQFLPQMNLTKPVKVLDFGANGGGFPLMLKLEGVNLEKVLALEFNPNTFSRMRFNLERNLECDLICLNAAITGESAFLEMHFGSGGTADSLYSADKKNGSGKLSRIQGLTFNEIYTTHFKGETIDICKMDIEGAEHEIFEKPNHSAIQHCRYLIMEIHPWEGKPPETILNKLAGYGFKEMPRKLADEQDVYFLCNKNLP